VDRRHVQLHIVAPEEGDAAGQIGDQGLAIDVAAVAEGVAVEEDVARDRPPLGAGEQIES
jgi:hypothetical protein